MTTVATSPIATAAPPAEPGASQPVELPDQRAVLFPELVGAPAPAAAPMDTAPDAMKRTPATPDAAMADSIRLLLPPTPSRTRAPRVPPRRRRPPPDEGGFGRAGIPRSGKPAEALAESGRRPTEAAPAKTRGATAEPEPEPPAPPKVREHDAHVPIRCGGTKLWCARDARDAPALAAFNKGAPKEKKTPPTPAEVQVARLPIVFSASGSAKSARSRAARRRRSACGAQSSSAAACLK